MAFESQQAQFGECMCIDRDVPERTFFPVKESKNSSRAIAYNGKQWANSSTITIAFSNSITSQEQRRIVEWANEWLEYANLNFDFNNSSEAQVRISRNKDGSSWSYIGTDALQRPISQATMNLGFPALDKATVLHEFGHMLSLCHEHQNPEGGIIWNKPAVYRDLSGPPNNWSYSQIDHNVIKRYSKDQVNGTEFDPDSIMLYSFPSSWTKNMPGTKRNKDLSQKDRGFIKKLYPGRGKDGDDGGETEARQAFYLPVQLIHSTAFSVNPLETIQKEVRFSASLPGKFFITSFGDSEGVLRLMKNSGGGHLEFIDEKEIIAGDFHTVMSVELSPGDYLLQIQGNGEHKVSVFLDQDFDI